MAEQIILDPSEVASNRTELDITPWISADGVDWGDASIEAYYSDAVRGSVPVDYRLPNRDVGGGLVFSQSLGGTTPAAARSAIQTKLALFQREGGWIKRVTAGGGTVYADVVDASFRATSVPGWASRDGVDNSASFSLSCIPDFYEDEATDADNSTTTARELIFTTALTGEGEVPQRVRTVVDNDGSTDWRGLIWAYRGRHYSSATTAQSEYEAEELGTLDIAAKTAGTTIYGTVTSGMWSGGTVVHHGTLSTSWTPALSTNVGGSTYLTHTGTYQVFARLVSTSGTTVQARFVWDTGDWINTVENPAWRFPGGGTTTATQPFIADLGEIRLDAAPVGTHRWQGQVQFKGDSGAEAASIDKLWIVNKDEGMGCLSASSPVDAGFDTFSARSEFNTESGAINGDSAAVGGAWASGGDATDVSVGSGVATRSEVSDADYLTGRYVASGVTAFAAQVVEIDFKWSALPTASGSVISGVIGRYTNTSNWLLGRAVVTYGAGVYQYTLSVLKRVGGTATTLVSVTAPTLALDSYYRLRLAVYADGSFYFFYAPQGGSFELACAGRDSDLATGGTLATGKPGFYDANTSATASITRTYDNFAAFEPDLDAVAYASQSVQLTTSGHVREDSGGTAYGPVFLPAGDIPRFPVPAQAGGTVETILIPTTGDLDQLPDVLGTASISARNYRRPSWLFVDGS